MKKLLLLLLAFTLVASAFAQSSNCGSISPEIIPINTIPLCDGVSTNALDISVASNLPNIGFLVIDVVEEADDELGYAIIDVDDDGFFIPADLELTYNQRFTVRPFAYDINEFRDYFDAIKNNSSGNKTCCDHAEDAAKEFCDDLSDVHGINSGEDINTFEDVWKVINAGSDGSSFSVQGTDI